MIELVALVLGYSLMVIVGLAAVGVAFIWLVEQAARTFRLNKRIIEFFFYQDEFERWRAETKTKAPK